DDAGLGGKLRRDVAEEPGVGEEPQPNGWLRGGQEKTELGGDSLAREVGDERRPRLDPGQGRRLDPEAEGRRQTDRPNHPQGVLLEAAQRVADGSQSSPGNVGAAVEWVDEAWLLAATRSLYGWGVSLPGRARRPPGHRV